MAGENLVIVERQIDVDVFVDVAEVSINFNTQEVVVMPAAGLLDVAFAAWTLQAAGFTPSNNSCYEVDTRSNPVTIVLPANPVDGFMFGIRDAYATFGTNMCIVAPVAGSGHKITQTAVPEETLGLNYPHVGNGFFFRFREEDATWSW